MNKINAFHQSMGLEDGIVCTYRRRVGLLWWLNGKESVCQSGDLGSIPGSGRFPGEGNGYPLQYSCLGNAMDRGAWQAVVPGVSKSQT